MKGILLLQMGGPSDLDEIESFLFNLFRDKYIIQFPKLLQPFQETFAKIISRSRTPKIKEQYKEIGNGSPIKFETDCQAKALAKKLNRAGDKDIKTYFAMRYAAPFLKDAYEQIARDGIEDLTVIPLYPHYSIATSGSSLIECKELFEENGYAKKASIKYVESWHDNDNFIRLIQNRIKDSLNDFTKDGVEDPNKIKILFSAHGLPEKYIMDGDPYQRQVEESVRLVMTSFPNYKHEICYQSKVGPVKWLEPSTEDMIVRLAKDGIKNMLIVPISFVGDHIETLYEIDIEYREVAENLGVKNYKVTRLPKANKLLIEALESQIPSVRKDALV